MYSTSIRAQSKGKVPNARQVHQRIRLAAYAAIVASGMSVTATATRAATLAEWLAPVSGNWTDAGKWSTNPYVPGNGNPAGVTYDARIAATGSAYTVSLLTTTVDSITLDSASATLSLTGGTVQTSQLELNAGTLRLESGARLKNATIGGTGGQVVPVFGVFDHVTLARDLQIGHNAPLIVENGLTLNGATLTIIDQIGFDATQTLSGSGTLALTTIGSYVEMFLGNLTIGPGITLQGGGRVNVGYGGQLVNNGIIRADVDVDYLSIERSSAGSDINNGLMEAKAGHRLHIANLDNTNGVVRAAGGQVTIGEIVGTQIGTLQSISGGSILLGRVVNTGHTLTATPTTGNLEINEVIGGTLATTGGATFASKGILTNVTLAGSVEVRTAAYSAALSAVNLTLDNGRIALYGGDLFFRWSELRVDASVPLAGTGEVVFEGDTNFSLVSSSDGRATIGSGITIRTGTGGGRVSFVRNQGTISAQTPGREINVAYTINDGTIVATNGSTIAFTEDWSNSGSITATAGATLKLGGTPNATETWSNSGSISATDATFTTGSVWTNTGSISATNSTVNLGGIFATPSVASFTRSGGTVNLTGTLTNTSNTLALTAATGSWNLVDKGKIVGGTLSTSGGAKLVTMGTAPTLQQVQNTGEVEVPIRVTLDGVTNSGDIVTTPSVPAVVQVIAATNTHNLAGGTIDLAAGGQFDSSGTWSNAGLIASTGGALKLVGTWTNTGTISANGGTVQTGGSWDGSGGAITVNNGATLTLGGVSLNLGAVAATDSAVNVGGAFTRGQLLGINRTNSSISLVAGGNINNSGGTIVIGPSFPLQLKGGTIAGGVLTTEPGVSGGITLTGAVVALDGVTLQTTLNVPNTRSVTFSGAWANDGIINTTGGTLTLAGTFATEDVGVLQRSVGGTVRIIGVMNNAGSTFAIDNVGTWQLIGGTIDGGQVTAPSGTMLTVSPPVSSSPSVFKGGVTFAGNLAISALATLNVQSALTLAPGSRVTLGGAGQSGSANLTFTGASAALSGSGDVVFETPSGGVVGPSGSGSTLTIGPDITIRTGARGGSVGGSGLTTINNGLLSAQTDGLTLTMLGNVTNNGTIEARNGGTVRLNPNPAATFTNLNNHTLTGGTWNVYAGSTINFGALPNSVTTNAANVTLSGAGSTFVAFESLQNNVGSFTVTSGRNFTTAGTFTNSGLVTIGAGSQFTSSGAVTWSDGSIGGAGNALFNTYLDVTGDVAKPGTGTLRVGWWLTLAAGKRLDLTEGKLIVASGLLGSAAGGAYTGLQGLVQSGRHGGAWDGSGIVTSQAEAAIGLTSIGVATAGQTGDAGGTFGGLSVSASDVLVMYTYAGDANLDGFISGDDYAAIDFNIAVPGASGWYNGDFNYDGIISGDDYAAIDFNIVAQGVPFATSSSVSGVNAVPEPAGTLALLAGCVALRRRARLTTDERL
jgi:hypothetical protein